MQQNNRKNRKEIAVKRDLKKSVDFLTIYGII